MSISHLARSLIPQRLRPALRHVYALVPQERRLGKQYWHLKRLLQEAQWWDKGRIEDWQLKRLRDIVRYAYLNIPGYYLLYSDAGVKPDDITKLDDIRALPFTTKDLLRDNIEDFTHKDVLPWKRRYITTGGSTGIPFGFYQTDVNSWMENAFMHCGWEWAEWRLGEVSAVLRGAFVGSQVNYWDYSPVSRELLLSSHYLTDETYDLYKDKIEEYGPKYLKAYPSVATKLADLVSKNNDQGRISFDVILLGSENVYAWQESRLRKAFPRARLFAWYGHAEQAVLAPWCELSQAYHSWPFYGLTEILDEHGEPVGTDRVGEIVGTSFWSRGTPFLRYRTADLARFGGYGCPYCRRQFVLLKDIVGRTHHALVLESGEKILLMTNWYVDVLTNVSQYQFYQDTPGFTKLRIVRKDSYSERDTRAILAELRRRLGDRLRYEIEFVNEILPTQRGKYQVLEQRLDLTMED